VGASQINLAATNLPSHTHALPGGDTGASGNGAPVENRQESLALNFLIAANGEIMIAPWPQQPTGWSHCDGRLLDVQKHVYLWFHIGDVYGGSGSNFALPDLQGRVVLGDDDSPTWPIGFLYGSNKVALTFADMPGHTHTAPGGATGATGGSGVSANNYQRSLVMRWMICHHGFFPSSDADVTFPIVSELRLIAGAMAGGIRNEDWFPVDGRLLAINDYEPLYYIIGTAYGGDGQATFALPNLINRVAIGKHAGLMVGNNLGTDTLLISLSQLAPHAHTFVPTGITGIAHFTNGSVQLTLVGPVETTWQVNKSDDLAPWSNLGAVEFTTPTRTITDPNPTNAPRRFYYPHWP
jgi:microcystin-dependent protein